ncbi:hypothetical protein AAG906_021241 [Vitis piasezkii]
MEKISILGFLLVILCLITRDLACKEALLLFKNGLKDSSSNQISSWIGGNCCQWEEIGCENNTGVIISINLHNPYSPEEAHENWSSMNLSGEIRPSLIELKSLRSLDLRSHWMEVFNKLSFLTELHLQDCGLSGSISSLNSINFTSLSVISISGNSFRSKFPIWLLNLSSLVYIDASSNKLYGHISPGLGELPNLQHLYLSKNENLTSSCSYLLSGSWKKIEFLNLAYNKFLGTFFA